MKITSTSYKLTFYVIIATFVLFQTSAHAVGNPGLVNQQEAEPNGFEKQISEAGCLRLLEKLEMDEDIREKAIPRMMSSESIVIAPVLRLCRAYYDDTSLLVRRLTQLLLMDEQKNKTSCVSEWVLDSYGRKSCKNELGQTVFKTLPIEHDWQTTDADGWHLARLGEFMDINGDGLPDFVIAFFTDWQSSYYRATFMNDGQHNWVMVACESNLNWPDRFAPCQ